MTLAEKSLEFGKKLLFPEQKKLYHYWLGKAGSKNMPARHDIHPKDFVHLLPTVSLIDVCHETEDIQKRYRVRLAGTHLADIYKMEITGLYFGELPLGKKKNYWHNVYNWITQNSLPATGANRLDQQQNDSCIQFWLHLPLSRNGYDVNMILCYDIFLAVEKAAQELQRQHS